jgi:hypothetical protein
MPLLQSLAAGFVGSSALTLIHQTAQKYIPHAPHVDAIGRRAIARSARAAGLTPPRGQALQNTALVGDLLANAAYYALVDAGPARTRIARGALLGLAGGLGAVLLPKPLGLGRQPGQRTPYTQALTVAWYTLGGLAAAAAAEAFEKMKHYQDPRTF